MAPVPPTTDPSSPDTALTGASLAAARTVGLAFALDATPRATTMPDSRKPESVALHSLALALTVTALDSHLPAELDRAAMLQFALVHDAVEILTGDTDTSVWTPELQAQKDAKEEAAKAEIAKLLPADLRAPWETYERQDCVEAQAVRVIDKIMPKLHKAVAWSQDPAGIKLPTYDVAAEELLKQSRRLAEEAPLAWPFLEELFWAAAKQLYVAIQARDYLAAVAPR